MKLILQYIELVKEIDELNEAIEANREQPHSVLNAIFDVWGTSITQLYSTISEISDASYSEEQGSEYQILRRCAFFRNKIARAVHLVIAKTANNKHDIQMAVGLYYGVPNSELNKQTHDGCLLQLLRDQHVSAAVAEHSPALQAWAVASINVLERMPVWEMQPEAVRAEIFLTDTFKRTTGLFNRLALWVAPEFTAEVLLQLFDERRADAYMHFKNDLKHRETLALRQKP